MENEATNEVDSNEINSGKINKRNLELVKNFLEEWLSFADNGESEKTEWINQEFGLCSNLRLWAFKFTSDYYFYLRLSQVLENLLAEDFSASNAYPFGDLVYSTERRARSHHKNYDRLAWVRKTIKKLENDILETTPEEY